MALTVKRTLSESEEEHTNIVSQEESLFKTARTSNDDDELENLYEILDISGKAGKRLRVQGVITLETLIKKELDLKDESLPDVKLSNQRTLYTFCLWYKEFQSKNTDFSDWEDSFNEDSLSQFDSQKTNSQTDDKASENLLHDDLLFFCNEMDIPPNVQRQLSKLNLTSVECIIEKKMDFESNAFGALKCSTKQTLLKFCSWYESFYSKHDQTVSWQSKFSNRRFTHFEIESIVERSYRSTIERMHEGRSDGGISVNVSEDVIDHAASITVRYLSRHLKDQCHQKFDPLAVATTCCRSLLHKTDDIDDTIHLVAGKTQSGKSTLKAVVAAVFRQLRCYLIIITKGIAERDDLKKKMSKLLGDSLVTQEYEILIIADTGAQILKAEKRILEIRRDQKTARFGVIVDECDAMYRTPDRAQIMEKRFMSLMSRCPSFRLEISATIFSAIVNLKEQSKRISLMELSTIEDYCGVEEMKHFQDGDGRNVYLKSQSLRSNEASVCMDTKCTPTNGQTPLLFCNEYSENPNSLKCEDCLNKKACGKHTDVACRDFPQISRKSEVVPHTNDDMMSMLASIFPIPLIKVKEEEKDSVQGINTAVESVVSSSSFESMTQSPSYPGSEEHMNEVTASPSTKKQGVLALIVTNPRVYAEGNIFTQATCIQNKFCNQGRKFVALVVSGRGAYFRFPEFRHGRFIKKSLKTVSEIINEIDKKVGLEVPIFIFGYSRLCRCVSFRSDLRVPTHMILARGKATGLEDYIQALGRATFNGLSVLRNNGHCNVTILTNQDDFNSTESYYRFVQELCIQTSRNPYNIIAAIENTEQKYPNGANFFKRTNRKIGRRRDIDLSVYKEIFEKSANMEDNQDKKEKYGKDLTVQRVFKIFLKLAEGNEDYCCQAETIRSVYNEVNVEFNEEELKRGDIKQIMKGLEEDVLFEKVRVDDYKDYQWKAKCLKVLFFMLDRELGDIDDDDIKMYEHYGSHSVKMQEI